MRTGVVAFICLYSGLALLGAESRRRGQDHVQGKIVGGKFGDIKDAPYQVAILLDEKHICSGAIISKDYILTAAHCLIEQQPERLKLRLGSTNRVEGGEFRYVDKIILHENFNNKTYDFDLGLAKMEKPIKETDSIKIIPLGTYEPLKAETILVTSWGSQSQEENRKHTEKLQFATMPVVEKSVCEKNYLELDPPMSVTKNMFCAGYMEGGIGTCNGDSGAPAVIDKILIGVVIGGAGCGYPEYPGLYNIVKNSIPWIKKNVDDLPPVGYAFYYTDWRKSRKHQRART